MRRDRRQRVTVAEPDASGVIGQDDVQPRYRGRSPGQRSSLCRTGAARMALFRRRRWSCWGSGRSLRAAMETTTMKASRWSFCGLPRCSAPRRAGRRLSIASDPLRRAVRRRRPTDAAARCLRSRCASSSASRSSSKIVPAAAAIAGTEPCCKASATATCCFSARRGHCSSRRACARSATTYRKTWCVAEIWRSPQVLIVHPKVKAKTLGELIALANPARDQCRSAGVGTLPHLSIELLKREAGVDIVHVPYAAPGRRCRTCSAARSTCCSATSPCWRRSSPAARSLRWR